MAGSWGFGFSTFVVLRDKLGTTNGPASPVKGGGGDFSKQVVSMSPFFFFFLLTSARFDKLHNGDIEQ